MIIDSTAQINDLFPDALLDDAALELKVLRGERIDSFKSLALPKRMLVKEFDGGDRLNLFIYADGSYTLFGTMPSDSEDPRATVTKTINYSGSYANFWFNTQWDNSANLFVPWSAGAMSSGGGLKSNAGSAGYVGFAPGQSTYVSSTYAYCKYTITKNVTQPGGTPMVIYETWTIHANVSGGNVSVSATVV